MKRRALRGDRPRMMAVLIAAFLFGALLGSLLVSCLKTEGGGAYAVYYRSLCQGTYRPSLQLMLTSGLVCASLVFFGAFSRLGALIVPVCLGAKGFVLSFAVTSCIRAFGARGYLPAMPALLLPGFSELFVLTLMGCRALEYSAASGRRGMTSALGLIRGDRSFLLCLPLSWAVTAVSAVLQSRLLVPLACLIVRRYC